MHSTILYSMCHNGKLPVHYIISSACVGDDVLVVASEMTREVKNIMKLRTIPRRFDALFAYTYVLHSNYLMHNNNNGTMLGEKIDLVDAVTQIGKDQCRGMELLLLWYIFNIISCT